MASLKDYLLEKNILFYENVDLKTKTWIHRGGTAGLLVQPETKNQLAEVVQHLYTNAIDFLVIGHTSNLYILNTTNIPVVVSTLKCNHYTVEDKIIECEAGTGVIRLAKEMVSLGIKGFEYLTGLPGTVGAALVNNSSCKTNSISSLLIDAEVVTKDGKQVTMLPQEFDFKYRSSIMKDGRLEGTILSMRLRAEVGDAAELRKIATDNESSRKYAIEGNAKNLGCTVNFTYSLGNMPMLYHIASAICFKTLQLMGRKSASIATRKLLCMLSGCSKSFPYISEKNVAIFIWKDENADEAFPYYLRFMEKVYRTNSIEIQII